ATPTCGRGLQIGGTIVGVAVAVLVGTGVVVAGAVGVGVLVAALTVGTAVEAVLAGVESDWSLATVGGFVGEPAAGGRTESRTVAVPPTARLPRLQDSALVPVQVPWVAVADTNVRPPGSVSLTTVPVAIDGPLLVTIRV